MLQCYNVSEHLHGIWIEANPSEGVIVASAMQEDNWFGCAGVRATVHRKEIPGSDFGHIALPSELLSHVSGAEKEGDCDGRGESTRAQGL